VLYGKILLIYLDFIIASAIDIFALHDLFMNEVYMCARDILYGWYLPFANMVLWVYFIFVYCVRGNFNQFAFTICKCICL
jgi:hypothetical protein